jgi:dolichyl-phosphate beta-glucosyltransferase
MSVPTLSLVIPAYNEARRLPRLLDALRHTAAADVERAGFRLLEAIVVDDGSTDTTAAALTAAAADTPVLRPLVYGAANRGKGHAVRSGAAVARGDYVLMTDVDLAAPLAEVAKLHEAVRQGADVAIGSRALSRTEVDTPAHRRLMGGTFNLVVRLATGLRLRDTQCGFKLLAAPWARAVLERQISEGYAFDVEVLMRARGTGLKVAEIPVEYHHDDDSRVPLVGASLRMAADVLRLAWHLRVRRGARPLRPVAEPEPDPARALEPSH